MTGKRGRGRPLVVTRDEELLDELLRLAGAGRVEVSVAADGVAAEAAWASAPLVVVGADRVGELARRGLPPRLGVVVVARDSAYALRSEDAGDPESIGEALAPWAGADLLHAEHVVVLPVGRPWLVARFAEHGRAGSRTMASRAAVAAIVTDSESTEADEISATLAVEAARRGLPTMLLGRAGSSDGGVGIPGRTELPADEEPILTVLTYPDCGARMPPEAMAVALQAGRHGYDLVVAHLTGVDEAAQLALTCADRGYLVVTAEVRACSAAARTAALAARHCPDLGLVVRSAGPRGLRPAEVAAALSLPLVGVLPPPAPPARLARHPGFGEGPLHRVNRRILADLGLAQRAGRRAAALGSGR